MAITAGALSQVSVSSTSDSLLATASTGGTAPYSYQWYRSTVTGFSPGSLSAVSGATALSLNDSPLTPGTQYYYKVVVIDSAATPLSASYTQLGVLTTQAVLSQNQFAETAFLGLVDQQYAYDTLAVQVDVSQATALVPGQAVKMVNSAGGLPKVVACSANTDEVLGFINYNFKDRNYPAYAPCEISQAGNVIYLYATTVIARGAQVTLDLTTVGGVQSKNTGDKIVGWAMDQGAVGSLIRVHLATPSFTLA